jgi:hypothetical protein
LRIVTIRVWHGGDRKWPLNEEHTPNFRGVRVHVSTGYKRVEGNRRASRNGRVSDLPPEINVNERFATFFIAVWWSLAAPYALVTTAISADLGTHASLKGSAQVLTPHPLSSHWRAPERRHATGRERLGSPTLQTLQEPILLLPWVCFRGGGFPNPLGGRLVC